MIRVTDSGAYGEERIAAEEYLRHTEHAVAVVVMATRGHTGRRRMRLGSAADRVVHQAHGPVLLIRG